MKTFLNIYRTISYVFVIITIISVFNIITKTQEIYELKIELTDLKYQIKTLNKKIQKDSLTLDVSNKNYYSLWEENQIFSSMLSEIENEPNGHDILKKLWNKSQK